MCYGIRDRVIANGGTADGWFIHLSVFCFPDPTRKEMSMFGLQPIHLMVIIVVAILLFAPSRLPEVVRALGRTVREFRAGVREGDSKALPESGSAETNPKEPSH